MRRRRRPFRRCWRTAPGSSEQCHGAGEQETFVTINPRCTGCKAEPRMKNGCAHWAQQNPIPFEVPSVGRAVDARSDTFCRKRPRRPVTQGCAGDVVPLVGRHPVCPRSCPRSRRRHRCILAQRRPTVQSQARPRRPFVTFFPRGVVIRPLSSRPRGRSVVLASGSRPPSAKLNRVDPVSGSASSSRTRIGEPSR